MYNFESLFRNCETLEELKKLYRKLAMKHHPDHGGSLKEMQEINSLYESYFERLKASNNRKASAGAKEFKHTEENASDYMDLINELITLDGLTIDVCGSWVWISGNTYLHKDKIKELGFRYSKSKKSWYRDMSGNWSEKKRRGHYSMNQIYEKFGRVSFESKGSELLEA